MDSPVASLFFRRLFSHGVCQSCRRNAASAGRLPGRSLTLERRAGTYSRLKKEAATKQTKEWGTSSDIWQPRSGLKVENVSKEFDEYPITTAEELRQKNRRPRRQKMLMRDFIEGAQTVVFRGFNRD